MPSSDGAGELERANREQETVSSLYEQIKRQTEGHGRFLQIATIISVLAALVSMGATSFGLYRELLQENHRLRGELTTLIQRLTTLKDKKRDNSNEYSIISRLAYNTAVLIEDQVSSPEHAVMAGALLAAGDFKKSVEFGDKAVQSATNFYDATWALRQRAWIETQISGDASGSEMYRKALEIYSQYDLDKDSTLVKTDSAFTYIEWAQVLAVIGKCREAQVTKTKYDNMKEAVVFLNDRKALEGDEIDFKDYLNNCHGSNEK